MKKLYGMIKKITAAALAACMTLSLTVPEAFAEETQFRKIVPEEITYEYPVGGVVVPEAEEPVRVDSIEIDDDTFVASADDYAAAASDSSHYNYFYTTLASGANSSITRDAQATYNALVNAFSSNVSTNSVFLSNISDWDAVCAGYFAFYLDYPEYAWLGGIGGQYIGSSMRLNIKYSEVFAASQVPTVYRDLTASANRIVSNANKYSTDYEKLKSMALELADMNTYDNEAVETNNREPAGNAYSALVRKLSICDGYARAFKVLCDKVNIPCIRVGGVDHAWNAVYFNGGWYYIDVTWLDIDDDAGKNKMYDCKWFMCGTNTAIANDNSIGSHTTLDTSFSSLNYVNPSYSRTDYNDPSDMVALSAENFPDSSLRSYLSGYDENSDSRLSLIERSDIWYVQNCSPSSFTGIEYLYNLWGIYVGGNFHALDISANKFFKNDGSSQIYPNNFKMGEISKSDPVYVLDSLGSDFDPSKVTKWTNASYDSKTNSIRVTASPVTYTYNCGRGMTVDFKMTYTLTDKTHTVSNTASGVTLTSNNQLFDKNTTLTVQTSTPAAGAVKYAKLSYKISVSETLTSPVKITFTVPKGYFSAASSMWTKSGGKYIKLNSVCDAKSNTITVETNAASLGSEFILSAVNPDVNKDGSFTASDLTALRGYLSGNPGSFYTDINEDGKTDHWDISVLRNADKNL